MLCLWMIVDISNIYILFCFEVFMFDDIVVRKHNHKTKLPGVGWSVVGFIIVFVCFHCCVTLLCDLFCDCKLICYWIVFCQCVFGIVWCVLLCCVFCLVCVRLLYLNWFCVFVLFCVNIVVLYKYDNNEYMRMSAYYMWSVYVLVVVWRCCVFVIYWWFYDCVVVLYLFI